MKLAFAVLVGLTMFGATPVAALGQITIFGDSTGKGDGALVRWHHRLVDALADGREIENASASRLPMSRILHRMEETPDLGQLTIIYDRRNAGETVEEYLEHLHEAADLIGHERFLILPQVPVSGGREDGTTLPILLSINGRILEEFADNTFDAGQQQDFLDALSGDQTRSDRIHRNDVGQQIEADFIARWIEEKGY